jgi:hypothetical protein
LKYLFLDKTRLMNMARATFSEGGYCLGQSRSPCKGFVECEKTATKEIKVRQRTVEAL